MAAIASIRGMILAACLTGVPLLALAGPTLQLSATARSEVPNDEMVVTMAVERTGPDVGALNRDVLARLNQAIEAARAVPAIRPRLGGVGTQPNWVSGKQSGWQVRGEIVLESSDLEALSRLSGRLAANLQLASVHFRLSQARRMEEEKRLMQEAARNFREKAAAAVKAFGYDNYSLRDLALQSGEPPVRPMQSMRAMSAAAMEMAPVPAESGRSDVEVGVSGTVEFK